MRVKNCMITNVMEILDDLPTEEVLYASLYLYQCHSTRCIEDDNSTPQASLVVFLTSALLGARSVRSNKHDRPYTASCTESWRR
jgi:uncharacterized protein involved in propanediol utilization